LSENKENVEKREKGEMGKTGKCKEKIGEIIPIVHLKK
jgi:hypothetical protein